MSEPVGNSARSPESLPGNSHQERKQKDTVAAEEREPVQKIVAGPVSTRKTPWYKKLGNKLIAQDASSMGEFLLDDVFVPAIKRLISESVRGGTDRLLYGTVRPRGTMGEERGSLRTRYDRMSEPEPRRMMSRDARARHDFAQIVLSERAEAITVVEALIDRVERYGTASVADLYDFVGETGSYADRNYGWRDLRTADVRQVPGGWLLDLPGPELLR